jgi:hypothetical protein
MQNMTKRSKTLGGTQRTISEISACSWDPKKPGSLLLLNDESEVISLILHHLVLVPVVYNERGCVWMRTTH